MSFSTDKASVICTGADSPTIIATVDKPPAFSLLNDAKTSRRANDLATKPGTISTIDIHRRMRAYQEITFDAPAVRVIALERLAIHKMEGPKRVAVHLTNQTPVLLQLWHPSRGKACYDT